MNDDPDQPDPNGTDQNDQRPAADGEVIPQGLPLPPTGQEQWLAVISNYTNRPDLLLRTLEEYCPGFIKKSVESAEARSDELQKKQNRFSEFQAYSAHIMSLIAAVAILGGLFVVLFSESVGFWPIVGLSIFYAVAQSGAGGFYAIASGIVRAIRGNQQPPSNQ